MRDLLRVPGLPAAVVASLVVVSAIDVLAVYLPALGTERGLARFRLQVGRPLSELPVFEEAERAQLLTDWNATAAAYPREATIPGLFRAQAERAPDAPALDFARAHGLVATRDDKARVPIRRRVQAPFQQVHAHQR